MKPIIPVVLLCCFLVSLPSPARALVKVVATTSTYASLARDLGGERAQVRALASPDQDVHFVRPKPSFVPLLADADLLLTTGMDLELWLPSLIDKVGNARLREGQVGYVAVAEGVDKLDIPESGDRANGGVHLYGNPHITTSPLNLRKIAENITIGLIKVDPQGREYYQARLKDFRDRLDRALFGDELLKLMGSDTLLRLARSGNLLTFLRGKQYKGRPMSELLGGWMKKAEPLHGKQVVTYHKNWVYFVKLFGLEVVGEIEPKPAIPPSPHHVEELINLMSRLQVRVVMAASYFDEARIRQICDAVQGRAVILPLYVDGIPEAGDVFLLTDYWLDRLLEAYGVN